MKINHKIIISRLLDELSFRTPTGIVDLTNSEQLSILSEILTEWGLDEIKHELFRNLNEEPEDAPEEKKFDVPALNKTITYTDENGEEKENIVGNLLRLDKDHPGNKAAQKALPVDPAARAEAMKALGNENSPTNDSTPGDGAGGDAGDDAMGAEDGMDMMEPETGTAFDGEQGDVYRAGLPDTDPLKMKPEDAEEE